MTEAMPFLQKIDITFLRPPTITAGLCFFISPCSAGCGSEERNVTVNNDNGSLGLTYNCGLCGSEERIVREVDSGSSFNYFLYDLFNDFFDFLLGHFNFDFLDNGDLGLSVSFADDLFLDSGSDESENSFNEFVVDNDFVSLCESVDSLSGNYSGLLGSFFCYFLGSLCYYFLSCFFGSFLSCFFGSFLSCLFGSLCYYFFNYFFGSFLSCLFGSLCYYFFNCFFGSFLGSLCNYFLSCFLGSFFCNFFGSLCYYFLGCLFGSFFYYFFNCFFYSRNSEECEKCVYEFGSSFNTAKSGDSVDGLSIDNDLCFGLGSLFGSSFNSGLGSSFNSSSFNSLVCEYCRSHSGAKESRKNKGKCLLHFIDSSGKFRLLNIIS